MKFSNVLKVFGAAALVAGLTPYRITRDEETGEKNGKIQGVWKKVHRLTHTGKLVAAGYKEEAENMDV